MPGHVAQMQRLFQTAKASLRLDMRFAASPTGSIDSRMPTSSENGSSKDAESPHPLQPASGTPKRDWRYSTAPQLIAEFDVDVREPFPEGSPRLPELPPIDMDHIKTLVVEPTSSGFASPVENTPVSRHELNLSSPTVHVDSVSDEEPSISPADYVSAADLEKPMTRLRVHGDHEMDLDSAEESPILSHLKRRSADICDALLMMLLIQVLLFFSHLDIHGANIRRRVVTAGKWTGHSPAPDSMIRDSYRTDTLTRFAKPPSRFKKHGVAALANARGVSRYYGRPLGPRPTLRQKNSSRTRFPDDMRFRSSPPRSMTDLQATGLTHPRKRSGELESPTIEVLEHETPKRNSVDSKLRLEEGEDVIELDEETRAAVRMSLYGAAAPDSTNDIGKSLKELSPNVMQWRKSNQPPWSRKKRRPSYWDGDLEEVVKSPAARHVLSSPIRKDDVRSQKGEVGYHGTSSDEENPMTTRDISNVVQGGTIPQEDVTMEG
ncbi:hypothetical protein LTR43_006596 [Exophiala xenobiotica]|nr:hypothetical protein LTR55_006244 [Exophiala xenobiotica]